MITTLAVLASAVGALLRLTVDSVVKVRWPTPTPWATVGINITGSAIIGAAAGAVLFHDAPTALQSIVGTGFCGGYTTFSTASFETVRLAQQGERRRAALYAVVSLIGSVAACAAGMLAASSF